MSFPSAYRESVCSVNYSKNENLNLLEAGESLQYGTAK